MMTSAPLSNDHLPRHRLGAEIGTAHVNSHNLVEVFHRHVEQGSGPVSAGIVDEDVDWPEFRECCRRPFHMGDIQRQYLCGAACRFNFARDSLQAIAAPRREHDVGAGLGECRSAGAAEAATRTSNQRPPAVEAKGRRSR